MVYILVDGGSSSRGLVSLREERIAEADRASNRAADLSFSEAPLGRARVIDGRKLNEWLFFSFLLGTRLAASGPSESKWSAG